VRKLILAAIALAGAPQSGTQAGSPGMPTYTAESVVNAATGATTVAVGTLVSIYGENLSFDTAALGPQNISGRNLPTTLAGTRVLMDNIDTGLYYVSPKQINFLIGPIHTGPEALIQVVTEGRAGPAVRIPLAPAAPGLFLSDPEFIIGTRADGSVVMKDSPVHPGEIVVLYATGLGTTQPRFGDRELPNRAAVVTRAAEFRVELNGTVVDPAAVFYVGVTPGFAGLYQINLRLPADLADNPEIRVGFDGQMSSPNIKLPLRSEAVAAS
jgi:uncharacterized protein (TIGR03437 family)